MKQLVLVRHAKSSWKEPGIADLDRPLNERGRRDAPRMAERLAARGACFDAILSSPAVRAFATAEAFAAAFGTEAVRVDALYLAGVEEFARLARGWDERWQGVLLVAHQPGLGEFVRFLADFDLEHLPTCGVAELGLGLERWSELRAGCGELVRFDFPKRVDG